MTLVELLISGSLVILGPTDYPNAQAQVVFKNRDTNSDFDVRAYPLSNGDVGLTVYFSFNMGAAGQDEILVVPPVGWTCLPVDCRLALLENHEGIIYLFPWEGM